MKSTLFINKAIYASHDATFIAAISRFLGLLLIFLIGSSIAAASTGFDPTFGNGGKVISSPDGSERTIGRYMTLQSDGKIVMIGDGATPSIIVARYNSDGSPDTTFGNNGWTSISFEAASTYPGSVAVQPDGKIVVGGSISTVVNNINVSDFAVARLNSNGSLDTTFDGDGKTTVSFSPELIGSNLGESLITLKIAPDGKIVAAGHLGLFPQIGKFAIARLNTNGSLDTSFGTNGRVIDNLNYYKLMYDMTVLADGSIVVGGGSGTPIGGSRLAQKYNVNGGLEWTYEGYDGTNINSQINSIAALPDGKLIIAGNRSNKLAVIRLNADGTVDSSFNSQTEITGTAAGSAAIQPDGKIVVNYYVSGYTSFSLLRFNSNGTLDTSFGSGGTLNVRLTDGQDIGQKVLIQPNGKILVSGYSILSNPERRYFSIARFQVNTTPNKTKFDYDGDGKADISVYRPSNGGWYLNQSTNGFLGIQFGLSNDKIVPADYDGDGKTDVAIYRDGVWWILQSGNYSVIATQFGLAGDKPQSGDFDGDGKDDLVVYRPSSSVWYVLRSSDNGFTATQWGLNTDVPQSADYDGDGKADLAVFRSSNATWYIQRSLGGNLFVQFGREFDTPVAADYDGDGKADIAIWRFYSEEWFILRSSDGQAFIKYFDTPANVPVPADYDGDGKADIAMFRSVTGMWYQQLSSQGYTTQQFGMEADRATPAAFNP